MLLRFDDGITIEAHPHSGPHRFSGDVACEAELMGDELLDLNLMVRAPFLGAVHQAGETSGAGILEAAYLFALDDLPSQSLRSIRSVTLR